MAAPVSLVAAECQSGDMAIASEDARPAPAAMRFDPDSNCEAFHSRSHLNRARTPPSDGLYPLRCIPTPLPRVSANSVQRPVACRKLAPVAGSRRSYPPDRRDSLHPRFDTVLTLEYSPTESH